MDDLLRFEFLCTTDADIVRFEILDGTVRVEMRGVKFIPANALARFSDCDLRVDRCELVFEHAVFSERTITDYDEVGVPIASSRRVVIDVDIQENGDGQGFKIYEFEGRLQAPDSWIDWKIKASECRLLCIL